MKKLLFATSALVALAAFGSAQAADLHVKAQPPAYKPSCAQFGGFYIGGHVGAGYYDHAWNDRDAWTSENSDDLQRSNVRTDRTDVIGGIQGGYNWQNGCTVFGIQVDYGWSSINASVTETDGDTGAGLDSLTVESRLRGMGTVRARTGVVVDNVLIYVTGGLGFGDFRRTYSQFDAGIPATETFTSNRTKWAWVAGFGTEWAAWGNWSIQSEVLYARFERDEQSFLCAAAFTCGAPGELKRFEHNDSVWISKVGLNYRFGNSVYAKY